MKAMFENIYHKKKRIWVRFIDIQKVLAQGQNYILLTSSINLHHLL